MHREENDETHQDREGSADGSVGGEGSVGEGRSNRIRYQQRVPCRNTQETVKAPAAAAPSPPPHTHIHTYTHIHIHTYKGINATHEHSDTHVPPHRHISNPHTAHSPPLPLLADAVSTPEQQAPQPPLQPAHLWAHNMRESAREREREGEREGERESGRERGRVREGGRESV